MHPPMTDPAAQARLTVDLDALAANYATLAREAGGAEIAPAVKADGYGLGVGPVAKRLWAEGARRFFVARLAEGEELRAVLGQARPAIIYVLDGAGGAERLFAAGLTPVLNSAAEVETWNACGLQKGRRMACAIHIDTGMNRLGMHSDGARALVAAPGRLDGVEVELVMSHLACADDPAHPLNAAQAAAFLQAAQLFPAARKSLANSGGVFMGAAFRFDMVRPGISLYGGGPQGRTDARLRTVATLEAPILQVRTVRPGESVGYGATWTATQPTRVATLAAGYADGVLRSGAPGGYGWLEGRKCPFVGRVSMDLIAVDVGDSDAARPGAYVELIGAHAPVDAVAAAAGTIAYEVLARIAGRVARCYVGEAA
jgi:alanine racemase